jgi:hypothetical protein
MAKKISGLTRSRSRPHLASFVKLAHGSRSIRSQRSMTLITLGITGGWLFSNLSLPVRAATMINNSGLEFEQDTTLDSNFVESHGAYQSTFGVIDLLTKEKIPLLTETKPSDRTESIFKPSSRRSHVGTNIDFSGTPGNAFKANRQYVLYLESSFNGRPTGIVYSNDVLNPNREQQVKFAGTAADLCTSGVMVNWDDTGSKLVRNRGQQDRDFDDFIVQLKGTTCAVGGGEPPTKVAEVPPPPAIKNLPPTTARGRFPWALGLLGLPFAFLGGNGGERSTPPSGIAPIIPPGGGGGNPPENCPSGNCAPVPEPLTLMGTGTAIAFGAMIQRRRKRRNR